MKEVIMNLGFSTPVHPTLSSPQVANEAFGAQVGSQANPLLARTAAVAIQTGVMNLFFGIINTNRHFVSRMAILSPTAHDDDTFDKKQTKNIIRKLKTEKTEPSNDQRPQ